MARRVLIRLVVGDEVLPTLYFPSNYRYVASGDIIECGTGSPFLECKVFADNGFREAEGVYKLVSMVARVEPRLSAFGEPAPTFTMVGMLYIENVLGDIAARITIARVERNEGWDNEELLLIWDVHGASLWWGLAYDAVAKANPVAKACGMRIYRVDDAKFYHVRRPLSRLVKTRIGRIAALESGHALIPTDTTRYLKHATTTIHAKTWTVHAAAIIVENPTKIAIVTANCMERIELDNGDYIAMVMSKK